MTDKEIKIVADILEDIRKELHDLNREIKRHDDRRDAILYAVLHNKNKEESNDE